MTTTRRIARPGYAGAIPADDRPSPNRRALLVLTAIWVPLLVAGLVLRSVVLDGLAFVVVGGECLVYNREAATSARLIGSGRARRIESAVLGAFMICVGIAAIVAGIAG